MTRNITRKTRSLAIGVLAAAIAVMCLPPDLAAQQRSPDTTILMAANPVVLPQSTETVNSTQPVEAGKPSPPVTQRPTVPVWVPRARTGLPAYRKAGATRGREEPVTVWALVPEYTDEALTLAAQPTLYWYSSADMKYTVTFTLTIPGTIDPIVEDLISGPFNAGIHALSLADYGVQLEPGRHYVWSIATVPDPNSLSAGTEAFGAIFRIADAELTSRVALAKPDAIASMMAESGIWYETLDALSRAIEQNPGDPKRLMQRTAMLEQVGLVVSEER